MAARGGLQGSGVTGSASSFFGPLGCLLGRVCILTLPPSHVIKASQWGGGSLVV